ncbi:MAG: hypothetical protein ACK40S_05745 [Burkholderiaceae bacterium]
MVLALLLTSIAGLFALQRGINQYEQVVGEYDAQALAVVRLRTTFQTQVQEWKNTLLRGHDPAQFDKYWNAFLKNEAAVQKETEQLIAALADGEAKEALKAFKNSHLVLGQEYRKGLEMFRATGFNDHKGADKLLQGKDREPAQSMGNASELLEERAKVEAKRVAEATAQVEWIVVVMMLGATAAGIFAAWTFGRSVMRSLGADPTELVAFTEQLTKGKLAQPLGSVRVSDNSVLKHLDDMRQQWLKVVGQVSHSSQNIGVSAAEIAQGNQDLSARTESAASSLEQTASSMEQLTETVRHSADAARSANHLASAAAQTARQGGETVAQAVGSMKGLFVISCGTQQSQ